MTPAGTPQVPAEDFSDVVAEAQAWLTETWDPDLSVEAWWQLVADAGWSKPQLRAEHGGRGLPPKSETVVRKTFAAHGALTPPGGLGHLMAAPTIAAEGSAEQISRHVPPTLAGRVAWCQLFSEPSSGSDLAGLTTRAERDGDEYVVTGAKVWTSQAMEADFGMLLARTDPDQPKHRGLSWVVLPLDQPGVEIRPLKEMTGRSFFNEVFIDSARCKVADRLGEEGDGWRIAQTTMMYERAGIGPDGTFAMYPHPGTKAGNLSRRAGDVVADVHPEFVPVGVNDLVALAAAFGRAADPVVRQDLARVISHAKAASWTTRRLAAADRVGPELASLAKMAGSRTKLMTVDVACRIVGAAGMLDGPEAPLDGDVAASVVASPGARIGGGTDEIHRNVVAERELGLPREPHSDNKIPFRELRKNS